MTVFIATAACMIGIPLLFGAARELVTIKKGQSSKCGDCGSRLNRVVGQGYAATCPSCGHAQPWAVRAPA